MSFVSKEEWNDWKNNLVTKAFYEAMNMRVEDAKEILACSAGMDDINDNFNRGFICAYREALDFRIEFDEETQ